jgi:hypothetical protein
MKRRTGLMVLFLVIAFLASACGGDGAPQIVDPTGTDFQVTTILKSNGAGQFIIAANQDYADEMGEKIEDTCDQVANNRNMEMTTEVKEYSGDAWCVGTIDFNGLQELEDDVYGKFGGVRIGTLTLRKEQLSYQVTYRNYVDSAMTWQLSLDGKWETHNADDEDGNTLRWKVNQGTTKVMEAEGSVNKGGWMKTEYIVVAVVFCCCTILLLVTLVVILITRRKKKSAPAAGA